MSALSDVQRALNAIRSITSEEQAAVRLEVLRLMATMIADEARDNFKIEYKYTYRCVDCGMKYNRQKRTINVSLDTCGECRGKLKMKTN